MTLLKQPGHQGERQKNKHPPGVCVQVKHLLLRALLNLTFVNHAVPNRCQIMEADMIIIMLFHLANLGVLRI
jgi:hypothetical protein